MNFIDKFVKYVNSMELEDGKKVKKIYTICSSITLCIFTVLLIMFTFLNKDFGVEDAIILIVLIILLGLSLALVVSSTRMLKDK